MPYLVKGGGFVAARLVYYLTFGRPSGKKKRLLAWVLTAKQSYGMLTVLFDRGSEQHDLPLSAISCASF